MKFIILFTLLFIVLIISNVSFGYTADNYDNIQNTLNTDYTADNYDNIISILGEEVIDEEFIIYLNSPINNYNTTDTTPDFNFTVINNESNYSCELFLDDIGYGINDTTLDNVSTIITANDTLSDGTYNWYINCTADSTTNQSEIREITIDTTPPQITVYSPTNTTYNTTTINLDVSAVESNPDIWWYLLNDGTNITFTPNTTITGIEGQNNITVWTNDTASNENNSEMIYFSVDITPPQITIYSPENISYYDINEIDLNWSVNELLLNLTYSLNGGNNISTNTTYYSDEGNWTIDANIISGISTGNNDYSPTAFYKNETWFIIFGESSGTFLGYNWTGSSWQVDNDIITGLGDVGSQSAPTVFQKNEIWYLISGEATQYELNGFNWTGSEWQIDNNIIVGLSAPTSHVSPNVFQKNNIFYAILGGINGEFWGYNWTGSVWQSDSNIISGLSNVGNYMTLDVFQKNKIWYLISGVNHGGLYGWNWTGSTWQVDNDIIVGLGSDVGYPSLTYSGSAPAIFEKDNFFFAILGTTTIPYGYNWSSFNITYDFANVTINLINGQNNVTIYATDLYGNMNSTTVYFFVGNTSKIIEFTSGNYLDYAVTSYDGTFALIGQNDTTPGITINNTGNINIDLNMSVNMSQESCFSFWISNDATLNISVDYNITNLINTTILTNINITDNQFLWTWMIFDSCTVGNEYWYTDYYDSFAS